jgi:ferrous iron transport protein A
VTSTLADLSDGSVARVTALGGERAWRRRLLELGFVPGTKLRVVRRVEVGNVLEVELRFSRVTLRIDEATALTVERLEGDAPSGSSAPASTPATATSTAPAAAPSEDPAS